MAAPFRNLGFEEANTNNLVSAVPSLPLFPAFRGTTADLLPGWETSWGTNFSLNLFPLGLGYETLTTRQNPVGMNIEGKYALVLGPNYDFSIIPPIRHVPISLWQIGEIPAEAKTIQFLVAGNPFEVWLNGIQIPLSYESDIPFPPRAVGDISAFAGQTVELRFITGEGNPPSTVFFEKNILDSIRFSPESIPEPSVWALLGFGIFALVVLRRRQRHCDTYG